MIFCTFKCVIHFWRSIYNWHFLSPPSSKIFYCYCMQTNLYHSTTRWIQLIFQKILSNPNIFIKIINSSTNFLFLPSLSLFSFCQQMDQHYVKDTIPGEVNKEVNKTRLLTWYNLSSSKRKYELKLNVLTV